MQQSTLSLAGPRPVDAADLERELGRLRASVPDPQAGLFGPASVIWRVDSEAAIFLGAARALLMQLAHPWVAAGIAEHSHALADAVGRFHRTFEIMFTMVFGTLDQAVAAARRLHHRHAGVRGTLPEAAGRLAAGSAYFANEATALLWVHATLTETALLAHDLVLPPLSKEERERYYAESRIMAGLFGLRPERLPGDWTAFTACVEAIERSDTLTVTPAARAIADRILAGGAMRPAVPGWYRAVTASVLPERLRVPFGLPYGAAEQRRAERALRHLRRLYRVLPGAVRKVGPHHEARRRLAGHPSPDLATRLRNRLWIGRPAMPGEGR